MEKTLNQEERIRRAEEIYYKRKNLGNTARTINMNLNPKKNYKLLKKILIQVIVCFGIYAMIYNLQGKNDDFSVDSINYLKNTIAYDINLEKYFNDIQNYLSDFLQIEVKDGISENTLEETLAVSEENNQEDETENNAIAEENSTQLEEASGISQMEEDAKYIKDRFSLIKPVTGTITSRFGLRNPTSQNVPKYHTGIDIAVPEGTEFIAAMDGTVELVSSEGDYR